MEEGGGRGRCGVRVMASSACLRARQGRNREGWNRASEKQVVEETTETGKGWISKGLGSFMFVLSVRKPLK